MSPASVPSAQSVFLTGASGFIGRYVVQRLVAAGIPNICVLLRSPEKWRMPAAAGSTFRIVEGNVADVSAYSDALRESDCVIHLAAATGAAPEDQMWRVNVEGTRAVVDAAAAHDVEHFILMSSIAAAAEDIDRYPYAQTKAAAERAVMDSGVSSTVLRPTIVLGPGAPNWRALRKLACLPVIPMPGGATAKVQPIDVIDVARGVEAIVRGYRPETTIIGLGGPEILLMSELLLRIRAAAGKRGRARVGIPLAPILAAATAAGYLTRGALPLGAGQFVPFVSDGIPEPNTLQASLQRNMEPLDELLTRLARDPNA